VAFMKLSFAVVACPQFAFCRGPVNLQSLGTLCSRLVATDTIKSAIQKLRSIWI